METKISVVIPNYNGRDLLEKNLPHILENCQECEIIVVDDASSDDSVKFLKENYKKIKVLENKRNSGFAKTINRGIKAATGDYVLLLNTDVAPKKNFLKKAFSNFENQENLFAVGLADQSHEGEKIITRGKGGAKFQRGFVSHFALAPKSGETLWVSGGSALFDKKKLIELQSFDTIFTPFYWEDVDLSYRAWKNGYTCLFDEESTVDHFHKEGAIKKYFSPFYVKSISYRNQFLFVWKNISDYPWLIQHILWQPFHFTKALISFDVPFFLGFVLALLKIPQLIFDSALLVKKYPASETRADIFNSERSDRQILEKFKN